MIITILSLVLCGAEAGLPAGECREVVQDSWEATSWREADFDWADCKEKRAKLIGRYEDVNCDQAAETVEMEDIELDDPYALPDEELGQYGD